MQTFRRNFNRLIDKWLGLETIFDGCDIYMKKDSREKYMILKFSIIAITLFTMGIILHITSN